MIVCLGWGSLIWRPDTLPTVGDWHSDGPSLPIEFARQSRDGRITLVVEDGAEPVPVLWVRLRTQTVQDARKALAERENVCISKYPRSIGHWSFTDASKHSVSERIGAWAKEKKVHAVVWTALRPRFNGKQMTPTCEDVVTRLRRLESSEKRRAEEYVRKTPPQIKTNYRKAIERALGWTALRDDSRK